MKRRNISVIVSILSLFIVSAPLTADLDDFKEGSKKSAGRSSGGSDNYDGECIGACMEVGLSIMGGIWLDINMPVHYTDYPYSEGEGDNFVKYEKKKKNEDENPEFNVTTLDEDFDEKKRYYFTFEGGGEHLGDEGYSAFGALRGKFCQFFGPDIAYRRVDDGEDHLHHFSAGLAFSLFQASAFTPDFHVGYTGMRGILKTNGIRVGLTVYSYPVKPLTLMVRLGVESHELKNDTNDETTAADDEQEGETIVYQDFEFRAGIMVGRVEFFGGYHIFKTDYADLTGPLGGVRVFF